MRKMLHGLIMAAILATAFSAMAGDDADKAERSLDRVISGRVAGQPVSCISTARVRAIQIIDRTAIVYLMSNGQIYVNRPTQGAQNLDSDAALHMVGAQGPLCTNEFVTFYDQGGRGIRGVAASVAMGPFVPYAPAPR